MAGVGWLRFGTVLSLIGVAGSAAAQDTELGSRLPHRKLEPVGRVDALARGYFDCLSSIEPSMAKAVVTAPMGSQVQMDLLNRNARSHTSQCLTGTDEFLTSMSFTDILWVGGLARAMYLRSGPLKTSVARLDDATEAAALNGAANKGFAILGVFARCIVATDPVHADALVRSERQSGAETRAMAMLAPTFQPCLFKGQQLSINRESLRAGLAIALFNASNPALVAAS